MSEDRTDYLLEAAEDLRFEYAMPMSVSLLSDMEALA
jgi:hypothetical protein